MSWRETPSGSGLKGALKGAIRRLGFDVVRHPVPDWLIAEVNYRRHLIRLLSRLNIDCVLDVGGHRGTFGTLLREIGYEGRIVSFEPVAKNFAILQQRSVSDPKWSSFPYALGSCDASQPINVVSEPNAGYTSFLQPNAFFDSHVTLQHEATATELVKVRRLDDVFGEVVDPGDKARVFLKMDTQGYDLQVLEGAGKQLTRILGLQSELSVIPLYAGMNNYLEAISVMTQLGFALTGLFPIDRDDSGRVVEFDCLMRRV